MKRADEVFDKNEAKKREASGKKPLVPFSVSWNKLKGKYMLRLRVSFRNWVYVDSFLTRAEACAEGERMTGRVRKDKE